MTQPEFLAWVEFHRQNPIDDLHRIYRPAAMVAGAMSNAMSIEDRLEWLSPEPVPAGMTAADVRTMRAFGVKPNFGKG